MKNKNQPTLSHASCRYGADMGRPDTLPADVAAPVKLHLARLEMINGDYDKGGAYWGGGTPERMYAAWNGGGVRVFVRAYDREKAKCQVLQKMSGAVFYR